jgi:hypothetical protein
MSGPQLSSERLIAAANAFLGLGEEKRGDWRGAMVECFLREVRVARADARRTPWHTAFIHHAGFWSHFDHAAGHSIWPLPATPNVSALAAYARLRGVLHEAPETGDLFLLWSSTRKRFVRTGIVIRITGSGHWPSGGPYHECVTIEGNTSETLAAGGRILMHERRFSPALGDRFVRWTALAARAIRADIRELPAAARPPGRRAA